MKVASSHKGTSFHYLSYVYVSCYRICHIATPKFVIDVVDFSRVHYHRHSDIFHFHIIFGIIYTHWHGLNPRPRPPPLCLPKMLTHVIHIFLFMTVKDDRLRCVKELVYAEEVYNDCLKSLFELYAEPLR